VSTRWLSPLGGVKGKVLFVIY
jgi:hypothetical protein